MPNTGIKLTPRHYAYLKISEGCNHKCSFCIIPSMRGKLVSRPAGEVMAEAERLVDSGTRELLVISQDNIGLPARTSATGPISAEDRRSHADATELAVPLGSLGLPLAVASCTAAYPYPHVDESLPLTPPTGRRFRPTWICPCSTAAHASSSS